MNTVQENDLDMVDLAEKCDRSTTFISKLLKGDTNLTRDSALAISQAMGVSYLWICYKSAEHLLTEEEKEKNLNMFNHGTDQPNLLKSFNDTKNNCKELNATYKSVGYDEYNKQSSLIEKEVLQLKQQIAVLEYWIQKLLQKE